MLAKIEVKDRKEAHQIKLGLSDPTARAFIKVIGILTTLDSQRAKERVLNFVKDHFDEKTATAKTEDAGTMK